MRRRPVTLGSLIVIMSCAAAGCASSTSSAPDTSPATTSVAAASPTASALTSPPTPASTAEASTSSPDASSTIDAGALPPATMTAPAAAPVLSLRPDGLALLTADGATASTLLFGTATAAQVDRAITLALGKPIRDTLPECGQGPRMASTRDNFSALYDGTRFVGWSDRGKTRRKLTTANGLGVGSTLAQVKQREADATVSADTLGPEFFSETGVSGMLDGTKSTSKVTLIYAGETCFFR